VQGVALWGGAQPAQGWGKHRARGAGLRVVALGASFGPGLPRTREEALRMPLALLPDTPRPPHFAAPVPSSPLSEGQADPKGETCRASDSPAPPPPSLHFRYITTYLGPSFRAQHRRVQTAPLPPEPWLHRSCMPASQPSDQAGRLCSVGRLEMLACSLCHASQGPLPLPLANGSPPSCWCRSRWRAALCWCCAATAASWRRLSQRSRRGPWRCWWPTLRMVSSHHAA